MKVNEYSKQCVSWAANTILAKGAKLYSIDNGWDIELSDGSWMTANNWQELCQVARKIH